MVAHLVLFAAILLWRGGPPLPHAGPSPVSVDFVELPAPEPPGQPQEMDAGAALPQQIEPPSAPEVVAPPAAATPTATPAPAPDISDLLSEAQLVGAARVNGGAGGGGDGVGGCNTARVLQQALQRDPLVRKAVADAQRAGKAVMLWSGDWVRSGDQEGKGLSGVREAIMWELAFAPEACRNARVNGLVLLSLADGTRFAIGAEDWRWSDLLGLRPSPAGR